MADTSATHGSDGAPMKKTLVYGCINKLLMAFNCDFPASAHFGVDNSHEREREKKKIPSHIKYLAMYLTIIIIIYNICIAPYNKLYSKALE